MSESENRRIVLLTGATRGLGRALVDRLVERGHTVVGCGRSQAALAELRRRYPAPHHFYTVDIADGAEVGGWADIVLQQVGVPDLVINNAALINRSAPLWEVPEAEFTRLLKVNIGGVANVVRAFVPRMIDQPEERRGVIANLSSGWGRSTAPEVAPYCATKFAVEGLTRALAQELPPGMAAVAVNPGIINTDMLRSAWGKGAREFPSAEDWSHPAVDFFLRLGPEDNGKSVTVQ
jgi:NAD(P)-dependent dehydrogenase (short-subunit alcohol dehydrogenase family)